MDIKQSPSGKIVKSPRGYDAFVPNPLPPEIEWDSRLVNSLSRADHLLGKLAREGSKLPNPHLLIRPFMTREAVLSSRIEEIQSTIGEILAKEAGASIEQNPDDLKEVKNYIDALDHGLERLNELPMSLRLIKEIHTKLMHGVRGSHATPGEFRHSQNWIGSPGCTLNTAKYVPPTPEILTDCLGKLELFLHDRQLPPLVHTALCHYQFEAIHPFLDGNGRVGRLLIILLLVEQKILPSPLLYLSAFFEATRNEYYEQLYSVSSNGSWNDWLVYFLNGVAVQAKDVLHRTEQINKLIYKWNKEIEDSRSQTSVEIIQRLAVNPYLTINKISENLDIAYSTAQRAIQKLLDKNIIKQVGEGKRDKVYCATEILEILEEPAKI